jgi:hypothetical protein
MIAMSGGVGPGEKFNDANREPTNGVGLRFHTRRFTVECYCYGPSLDYLERKLSDSLGAPGQRARRVLEVGVGTGVVAEALTALLRRITKRRPADTEHGFVGAGDGPCVIFMTGARKGWPETGIVYVHSELAIRHRAGVETETMSSAEAYAPFPKWQPGRPETWDGLPWA